MALLNFNNSPSKAPRNHKNLKVILGIGALAGVIALGSTLAASINLNTGHPVEFGQGIAQTTACDNSILVTPYSKFVNANGAGSFKFSSITLSNLDSTDSACSGKILTLKIYGNSGPSLASYTILDSGVSFSSSEGTITFNLVTKSLSSVTLSFTDPTIRADGIYRVTVESSYGGNIIYPNISTSPQSFNFNPALFTQYPTGGSTPGGPVSDNYPGWLVLKSPNVTSLITLYTYSDPSTGRDTVIHVYNSTGEEIAYDDDNSNDNELTDPFAYNFVVGNYSALSFEAAANETYYVGVGDYSEYTPISENLNLGYYYSVI